MWDKVRSYRKHVEEHIGNLNVMLKTHWEPDGNFMRTCWEQQNPPPPPTPKETKTWPPWMHATSPHCLQEFFLPTCIWVLHHFWARLMTRAWTMGVHSTLEYVESKNFLTHIFFLKTQIIRLVMLHSYETMLFETTRIWSNPKHILIILSMKVSSSNKWPKSFSW
jgi:hypothetical protein